MLFITCTKTNDINTEPVPQRCSSKKVFCKSSANLQYSTMQKCWAKFFEITFPYGSPPVHLLHTCRAHFWIEAMGATFENNSFAQVNSKYCLQKLKWRNLTLQKFCYLLVWNLQKSCLYIVTAGQENMPQSLVIKLNNGLLTTCYTYRYLFLEIKLFLHIQMSTFCQYAW